VTVTAGAREALELYDAALRDGGTLLLLAAEDGAATPLDLARWRGDADAVDLRLVARCAGPTVDLGCGPGRLVAALAAGGVPALGVDLSTQAVSLARSRGVLALRRDVLTDRLPGEGRWSCALLVDGSIGIGGDPHRLLRRTARLVRPGGSLLVEVDRYDVNHRARVRVTCPGGGTSRPFVWASVGARALETAALVSGWYPAGRWDDGGRGFVSLTRR
jgi:SAM-dependent methyltransferase